MKSNNNGDLAGRSRMIGAVLADFKKVGETIGHQPTYKDYGRFGRFAMNVIDKYFGTFKGLLDFVNDVSSTDVLPRQLSRKIDKHNSAIDALKLVNDELDQPPKFLNETSNGHKLLIVAADFHDEFVDPFCLKLFLKTCKDRQPDYIALAGDVMDFYELSYFDKNPSRIFRLQKQIDFVRNSILIPLRKNCPHAQIDYLIGNHEFRLIKFLMSNGQALASLRCLSLRNLLGLDELKINMRATQPFSEINDDFYKNRVIYEDMYLVTHGSATQNNHAAKELERWSKSGCSAHVHHRQKAAHTPILAQSRTTSERELDWISLGCMCKLSAGEEYMQDIVRWQQGFNIVHLFPDNNCHFNEYIEIKNGMAIVGGKQYHEDSI